MRLWRPAIAVAVWAAVLGCDDGPNKREKAPSRFAAVKKSRSTAASASFCDKTFAPPNPWTRPAEQSIAGYQAPKQGEGGWTWVNLWATWCGPCLEEMPLLTRWGETLGKEGSPVKFELWSVDEDGEALSTMLAQRKGFPGRVRWLKDPDDLSPMLESLGLDANAAIPIHAMIDPQGNLRCVRVGKVGEEAYGSVKAILTAR